ncbi:MAG: hypothetical protein K6A38_07850 [Lachnospiraceae bacterium]|nr:hypothetical protein [Lachnospiraceae bacterium]
MEKKTSFAYKIIRFIVLLFFPNMKVVGEEKLPDGPYILAGNHSQMYGPLACELRFPGRHYIWCISSMMVFKEVPDYAFGDFWSKKPVPARWFFRIFSYLIAPLAVCIFNNAYTIPVYKDKRIFETMELSVNALIDGAGVIVFPEDYDEHNNIVHDFQKGFVSLAKRYYAKTGKTVPFVPLYVCPGLKKLVIGDPVYYDPTAPVAKEQERICNILMDRISELAYELPYHKVVPYPNIPKKDYPDNKRKEAIS